MSKVVAMRPWDKKVEEIATKEAVVEPSLWSSLKWKNLQN